MGRKSWLRGCSKNLGSRQQRPQESIKVGSAVVNEVKSTGLRNQMGVEKGWLRMTMVIVRMYWFSALKRLCPSSLLYTSFRIK